MKFTPEQAEDMKQLKKLVTSLLKTYGATRSMRNLQFDITNSKEEKYSPLQQFKVSYGWISKMKNATLKPKPRSIVKQVAEEEMLRWLKKRKENTLCFLVTTRQVRAKWKGIYGKEPSRYALKTFRQKHSIQVIFDKTTRNTNSWVFRK